MVRTGMGGRFIQYFALKSPIKLGMYVGESNVPNESPLIFIVRDIRLF